MQEKSKLLLRNAYVVPGAGMQHLERADILIDGDRIAAMGPDLQVPEGPAVQVLNCSKRLALPGFINAHTHSNESFAQGFWDALPLEVWLLHLYPPFVLKALPERFHYLRTMLLAIESVRSGVTTVQDDLINRLGETAAFDGSAAAYRDIGLRASITTSMGDRQFLEPLPWTDELLDASTLAELATLPVMAAGEQIALFERHFAKWNGQGEGRIRVILGPIGPQWCTNDLLQQATEISLARNLPVHTHTLESKLQAVQAQHLYGRSMISHLDDLGVLTPNFTLNHAIWLTDEDIELIGARGCSISHNPLSNLKLGSGVARIRAMKNAGVNVALGTDGTSTSDRADMFRSLGMAALLHLLGSATAAGEPAALVDVPDALDADGLAPEECARLLWVRPGTLRTALRCADVILDGGGFAVVALYLAGVDAERAGGRSIPASAWTRLVQRAEKASTSRWT